MNQRQLCSQCQLPFARCLCGHIQRTDNQVPVFIMQHPSEVGHAKNTVPILLQSLSQVQCFVGEQAADFTELKQQLQAFKQVFVLYPSDDSQPLAAPLMAEFKPAEVALVVIDGTWRKALKILKLNPWLMAFVTVHLAETSAPRQGQYLIRQAKRADSFSTLEAVAYGLADLDVGFAHQPLIQAFNYMNQRFISNLPEKVQQYYL